MEEINASSGKEYIAVCYLPWDSSFTMKLRVVFNGSQRTKTGTSLNAKLLISANLLPNLADVFLR